MGSGSSKPEVAQSSAAPPSAANLQIYVAHVSPNSMCTMLTCAAAGVEPKMKVFNIFEGEHKKDTEFIGRNPYGVLPTLADGPFSLWESRAINAYIVSKYGKDKSLYPSDLMKRATIDKVLYHDATVLQPKLLQVLLPIIRKQKTPEECEDGFKDFKEALTKFENNILKDNKYVAGDNLTIADFSVITTLNQSSILGIEFSELPKLNAWAGRMKALPYFDECTKGFEAFKKLRASQ